MKRKLLKNRIEQMGCPNSRDVIQYFLAGDETPRVTAKVKFGQPETETETEEAEAQSHAFEKPAKKKKHSRKKRSVALLQLVHNLFCLSFAIHKTTLAKIA